MPPARDPVRVALVNDYEVVVQGLARMFDSYQDRIEIVELDVRAPVARQVDIVLCDTFARPQGESLDIGDLVRNRKVGRVVLYSWNVDDKLVAASRKAGVHGYLSKGLTAQHLVEALESVHRGDEVISTHPSKEVVGGDWPGRAEGLTAREAEVVALITQGLSNQEIVEHTYLSINSIKSYIRSAYRKMGVTSRSQAVLWGVRHGLMPDHARIKDPRTR